MCSFVNSKNCDWYENDDQHQDSKWETCKGDGSQGELWVKPYCNKRRKNSRKLGYLKSFFLFVWENDEVLGPIENWTDEW